MPRKPATKKDGRKTNGGARKGAGRPNKFDEVHLQATLKTFDDLAASALRKGLKAGIYAYWERFMMYRYGKPTDTLDITTGGDPFSKPLIDFFKTDDKD